MDRVSYRTMLTKQVSMCVVIVSQNNFNPNMCQFYKDYHQKYYVILK